MRKLKIVIGGILIVFYSLPFIINILNLFYTDLLNMSRAIGMVVGSGLGFTVGLYMLVSGIRNKKFNQAFNK